MDEFGIGKKTINPKTMRDLFVNLLMFLILPMMMGNLQTELFVT